MRTYTLIGAPKGWPESVPFRLHLPEGDVGIGDSFEHEFTPEDEGENLASGLLELHPSKYRNIGESVVHGHEPGEEFELALPLGQEELLKSHLERVEESPPKKPRTKRKGG